MTAHVTIPINDAAKADLDAWAEARGVAVADILSDAVETYIVETRSLSNTAARGRAAVASGDVHDHDDVVAEFANRREAWRSLA